MCLHGELSCISLIIGDLSDNNFVFFIISSLSSTLHIKVTVKIGIEYLFVSYWSEQGHKFILQKNFYVILTCIVFNMWKQNAN
jgi:hypothetical protein